MIHKYCQASSQPCMDDTEETSRTPTRLGANHSIGSTQELMLSFASG